MKRSTAILAGVVALALTGCASQSQFLNDKQGMAMQTALSRGKFDLNCPQAKPVLISKEVVQPALQGPWVSGIQRAEYTIGVEGCDKRQTYIVICPEGGEGCYAAGPGEFHKW
jgi:outer membrane lipoprotein SlyB